MFIDVTHLSLSLNFSYFVLQFFHPCKYNEHTFVA